MLEDEFKYFLEHKEEFADKYNGKFIVIKDQEIIGVYDSELEAIEKTSKKEKIGTFLVQKCEHGDSSITQTFHSRVSFSQGQSSLANRIDAFTTSYNGLSNVLSSKATIGLAFDPSISPPPSQTEFDAIWDTGATASVISQNVVQKCGLIPTGMIQVHTANGMCLCNTYLVSIGLPNKVGISSVRVTEAKLGKEDVWIGMDIIAMGDFAITNFEGKTVFSYRTPSVAKTDFVEEINRMKASQLSKIGRNDLCPCGSGKKYKKCHMRL